MHRWYQPGLGRYTKPDPLFSGPVDPDLLEEGHKPVFAYAGNHPTMLVDPLGLLALLPGTDCENFNDIITGLEQLTEDCACSKFFKDLGVDLPTLISGAPPFLETFPTPSVRNPQRRKGFVDCKSDPDNVRLAQKFCNRPFFFPGRRIHQATAIVLHELAHYADCRGNNDQFPGEEGQDAEIACFGKVLSGDAN